jgi:aminopeptidase N
MGVYPNAENLRSDTIDIIDYEIHLDISDYSGKTLSGYTTVRFTPKMANVDVINLDLLRFSIDSISLNNANLTYIYNDTLIHINLGTNYGIGDTLDLLVHYNGTTRLDPSGWGGVYWGSNYAFNLGVGFEDNPHNIGRYWFPCFDNFKERTTYNLYLTTNDNQYATSIGDLISNTPVANNKMEWYWKLDETIPTYLAMFSVNYYTVVNDIYQGINGPIPINLYAKASDTTNLKGSFANLKKAMTAFEGLYGPYQFNKIGYTVVNFSSGAMEHASNISYPNNVVNGNLGSETLMAHELAHQWWGNYATTLTPQDMWLNEGMASFSAHYFSEAIYGWDAAKIDVKSTLFNILKKAHIDEGGYRAVSGVPHDLTYGDHVYRKGALVAQNLRMLLGENNFGSAVTGFLNSRAYNSMTSLQFRDYLQTTTSADVNGFFDGWVFNGGFPDYNIQDVTITPTPALTKVIVKVNQKLNHAPNKFTETPLEIGFYDASFNLMIDTILVGPDMAQIEVDLPIAPVLVTLNPNNKLCYATTDDIHVIKNTGLIDYTNALMRVDVTAITDSALIKIEHHWSAPDPIKDWANQPYRLSNYRYWKVDGYLPSGFDATADLLYDGRESGGYLDSLLVNVTEDSLVLLYRANASQDWEEYAHYTKNTLGSSTNKFGRILLSKLTLGEYTLANIDHSILSTGSLEKENNNIKIYPNPGNEKVTIEWENNNYPETIEIYSLDGKRVLQFDSSLNKTFSFNSKDLRNGQYIAKVTFEGQVYSKAFSVIH